MDEKMLSNLIFEIPPLGPIFGCISHQTAMKEARHIAGYRLCHLICILVVLCAFGTENNGREDAEQSHLRKSAFGLKIWMHNFMLALSQMVFLVL